MTLPKLFIGSSVEGRDVAHYLQVVLEDRKICDVDVWDLGVFDAGGYALETLEERAQSSDFAVLIASPDDVTTSRGNTTSSVRDNIILEFGLFLGALGRRRTYLLSTTRDMKLPSDILGLTRLPYSARPDGNFHAAVSAAALEIGQLVKKHGPRVEDGQSQAGRDVRLLELEIELLCANAEAQGWTVKNNNETTLRLVPPNRKNDGHTLSRRGARSTREDLRKFVAELRADGLRINSAIRF